MKIRTKLNKRVLDVSQSSDNGHDVGDLILFDDYGSENQMFSLSADGPDFVLKCVKSGKALEVANGEHKDGAKVIESDYKSRMEQKWRLQEIVPNSGEYYIYNSNSGKLLDVPEEKAENHVCVIQYEFNGNKNQIWILKHM